ncbi:MAG: GEVED domain-containing protein [Chitinophagaceae bacterium]
MHHRFLTRVLSCFLLFSLLFGMKAMAQTPMYYNNNNAPGGANAFPLSSLTSNRVQWLYGPNLFNSVGQTGTPAPSGFITHIYFRCPTVSAAAVYTNFTISLGQTMGTTNSFPNGTYLTNLTQSFFQASYSLTGITANTWYAIPLQTPFLYDPSLSLVWEMKVSAGTGNTIAQVSNAGLNQRIYGAYGNATGTAGVALADFGFDLIPPTPCSGMPVIGQINTGNMTMCPGVITTLGLTGNTLASGLSYQWQQSNNGGVTWNNVVGGTGANSTNYTTPALMTTTMYRMYAVCANGGMSDTTNPITITISSPSYVNTLPYHQSFENWVNYCGVKDIPSHPLSNHWTAVPATGNNSWRRNDEGPSAAWANPGLSAYMPSSTDGISSARFHSRNTPLSGNLDLYMNLSAYPGTKTLMFDFINNNASGGSDYLDIFVSTDAGINFTQVGTIANSPNWQTFLFAITSVSPTTLIRFRGVGDNLMTTGTDMGMDNLYLLPPCAGTPNAGIIHDTTPCANTLFKLKLENNTLAGSLNYTWQSAPSAGGPWTLVGNTLTPMITTQIPGPTYFRCIVTCNISGLTDTTPVQLINLGSFYYCYCSSNSTTLSVAQNIGNVLLTDPSSNSLINNGNALPLVNNASALSYYSPFFGLTPPTLYRDTTYNLAVTCFAQGPSFSAGYAKAFIDYNRDGVYDPVNELAVSGVLNPPSNLLNSSFVVPSNAVYGLTGMRIVYMVGGTAITVGPCGPYANGETEDYVINIAPPPCNQPPYAGIASISDTITCPGYTVFMSDTTHDLIYSGLTFNWQYSNDGITYFDIPGATADTLTYTVTAPTWFRFRTTCNGTSDAFSNTLHVVMSPPLACYGTSQSNGGSSDSSDIGGFMIKDYTTNSTIYSFVSGGPHLLNPTAIKKRTDYTGVGPLDLYVDSLYQFAVYHIMKGSVHADAKVTIFIDYNNNKIYDIPEERVFSGIADINNYYLNAPILTPSSPALSVPTGMRVVLNNNVSPNAPSDNAVGVYTSGETEDYLVRFNLKLFGPSSVNTSDYALGNVEVYPNPTSGRVYVGCDIYEKTLVRLKVLTVSGQVLEERAWEAMPGKAVHELSLTGYSSGVYFVQLETSKGQFVRKLTIE